MYPAPAASSSVAPQSEKTPDVTSSFGCAPHGQSVPNNKERPPTPINKSNPAQFNLKRPIEDIAALASSMESTQQTAAFVSPLPKSDQLSRADMPALDKPTPTKAAPPPSTSLSSVQSSNITSTLSTPSTPSAPSATPTQSAQPSPINSSSAKLTTASPSTPSKVSTPSAVKTVNSQTNASSASSNTPSSTPYNSAGTISSSSSLRRPNSTTTTSPSHSSAISSSSSVVSSQSSGGGAAAVDAPAKTLAADKSAGTQQSKSTTLVATNTQHNQPQQPTRTDAAQKEATPLPSNISPTVATPSSSSSSSSSPSQHVSTSKSGASSLKPQKATPSTSNTTASLRAPPPAATIAATSTAKHPPSKPSKVPTPKASASISARSSRPVTMPVEKNAAHVSSTTNPSATAALATPLSQATKIKSPYAPPIRETPASARPASHSSRIADIDDVYQIPTTSNDDNAESDNWQEHDDEYDEDSSIEEIDTEALGRAAFGIGIPFSEQLDIFQVPAGRDLEMAKFAARMSGNILKETSMPAGFVAPHVAASTRHQQTAAPHVNHQRGMQSGNNLTAHGRQAIGEQENTTTTAATSKTHNTGKLQSSLRGSSYGAPPSPSTPAISFSSSGNGTKAPPSLSGTKKHTISLSEKLKHQVSKQKELTQMLHAMKSKEHADLFSDDEILIVESVWASEQDRLIKCCQQFKQRQDIESIIERRAKFCAAHQSILRQYPDIQTTIQELDDAFRSNLDM